MPMRHIVWDWNGTLFDDGHLVLEGLHAVLDDAGIPRVDRATYQRLYTRPVTVFYERLFGRALAPDEWERIDERFHAGYRAALDRAQLASDANDALAAVTAADGTQSLLSMFPHEELVPLVDRLGITPHFARVDGLRGAGGGVKAPFLERHLAALGDAFGREQVVVVGDALDDAAAAAHAGVDCVLYDGGSHPRVELERAGVPVAATLTEALERAGF
jgi:phosphoglycolate phosphatase-like HAD superfamily hydrolase